MCEIITTPGLFKGSQSGFAGPPAWKIGVWGAVKWQKLQEIKSDEQLENTLAASQKQ